MRRLATAPAARWLFTLIGVGLLAATAWVLGPLVPWLEDPAPRLGIIAAMLACWLAANASSDRARRRRDAALAGGVAGAGDTAAEAAALRERMAAAVGLLRRSGGRDYLYDRPWYAIIGPPGAGKTTALLNAGLTFPLADTLGPGAIAGVGGTRLCDWWFTDRAVLIDTAGRYTTQDSDASVDRAGWDAFLDLLRRTRPRQPLNGVIVAIALTDVAAAPATERQAHARAIRQRVRELEVRLGVRMPVYALFTKADLIAGFSEFFDDLDRDGRAQVWGMTFPLEARRSAEPVPRAFPGEFSGLVEILGRRSFDRLDAERSLGKRALIAGFPAQVATLEQPLAEFLAWAFGSDAAAPPVRLRGVYLASGTQEGTPIDRLTGAMARAFGLDQRRIPSLVTEPGRSYFLSRLLGDVILGEAMLVGASPSAARRRLVRRVVGFATALLAMIAAGAVLARRDATERQDIDRAAAALAAYERSAAGLPLDEVAEADLPRLAPLLDDARALVAGADPAGSASLPWWDFGLSQRSKLDAGAGAVYRHAIAHAFFPRLIWRLEAQLRGALDQPDFLYEATRVYLMLGGAGPLDRDLVREWMRLDWQGAYPGAAAAPLREALARDLEALLAEPLPQIVLDGDLVAAARAGLAPVSLAQRVYARIRPSAAAQAVPAWQPIDALGAVGANLFTRASGAKLADGIPGFFTVTGFHSVLLPSLGPAVRGVAGESWILGQRTGDPEPAAQAALEQDVIRIYTAEYAQRWDAVLADLTVVPMRSLPQAAQDLYILASAQSPMRELLTSASRQLTLSASPINEAGRSAAARGSRLEALFGTASADPGKSAMPGHEIDDRYRALREAVAGPGAPIDRSLRAVAVLQQLLAKMAAAPVGAAPPPPPDADPSQALRDAAQGQPQPLGRWLLAIADSGAALRAGGAKSQLVAAFNAPGGPAGPCPSTVDGKYPFVAGAAADAPLDDFARLFAPGGLIDGFVNTQLRPYVDTASRPWRALPVEGATAPFGPADLAQLQRAAAIRDMFFAAGGKSPTVRFDLTPISLDAGATRATLDLDGTTISFGHEPPRSTQITWPGPSRMQTVRLSFEPAAPPLQEIGPWALFRLFGHGRPQTAGSADKLTLGFQVGERQAVFELRVAGAGNPFTTGALRDFRCPSTQ